MGPRRRRPAFTIDVATGMRLGQFNQKRDALFVTNAEAAAWRARGYSIAESAVEADGSIRLPCMPIELFTSVLEALASRQAGRAAPEAAHVPPALAPRVAAAVKI